MFRIVTAVGAALVGLFLLAGPAQATVWAGPVAQTASSSLALGAPNVFKTGSQAELKPYPKGAHIAFLHDNSLGNSIQIALNAGGVPGLCLTSFAKVIGGPVVFETCHGWPSQEWTYAGSNPYSFRNVKSGLYLAPAAVARYVKVIVDGSPFMWGQH